MAVPEEVRRSNRRVCFLLTPANLQATGLETQSCSHIMDIEVGTKSYSYRYTYVMITVGNYQCNHEARAMHKGYFQPEIQLIFLNF